MPWNASRSIERVAFASALASLSVWSGAARAADVQAGPGDYRDKVAALQPGDTLHLAAGSYTELLSIRGLNGNAGAWITIAGPDAGSPAIFEADPGPCCNTIEIADSSYVVLKNLTVDGKKVDGAFGVNASGGSVHHITVEGCTFLNHDAGQQTVAISTKVTTWNWVIRNNRIIGAGTGLYLGNSDGSMPFIGGLIENNLVRDPIGYCMEIKWQAARTLRPGMPEQPTSTIIRNNVFIKTDRPSEDGDRPNLLVGGFPDSGFGAQDRYEIYGNFLFHNPREALLQASGRVSIHDNVFVDTAAAAILLADHDLPLRVAHVYNNTIYGAETGIAFSSSARDADAVIGNLVFATQPIRGAIQTQSDNLVDTVPNAATFVTRPSTALADMDFYPLAGKCEGPALDLAAFGADIDHDKDFNGASKAGFTFRGAYAGSGRNPGWKLGDDLKGGGSAGNPSSGGTAGSGGTSGSAGNGGTSSSAGSAGTAMAAGGTSGASPAAPGAAADDGGCGCRASSSSRAHALILLFGVALARRDKCSRSSVAKRKQSAVR